jgi:hypothetical protein
MFEKFHLTQPLFRFFFGPVGTAQVFALFGEHFVSARYFLDHQLTPPNLPGSGHRALPQLARAIPFLAQVLRNKTLGA